MSQSIEKSLTFTTTCFKSIKPPHRTGAGRLEWKHPLGGTFHAQFTVALDFPFGVFNLTYPWNNPSAPEVISDVIHLAGRLNNRGYACWSFLCPRGGPKCLRRVFKLYLGEGKYFGCRPCADVEQEVRRHHDKKRDGYLRNPEKIKKTLASPHAPTKERMRALEALQMLYKRRDRLKKRLAKLKRSWRRRFGARKSGRHSTQCSTPGSS